MGELLLYGLIIVVCTAVVWWGSDLLEKSATLLSKYYGLPPVVHGAMVVAIGSSFPELSSTVLATLIHGEFELGLSAVVGSAIFNILVIPGLAGIFSKQPLQADKELVYKDAQFYIISVAVLLLAFCFSIIYFPNDEGDLTGEMTRSVALIPILLYGLYIFIQQQEVKEYEKPERPKDINPFKEWARLIFSLVLIVGGVEGLVSAAIFLGEFFDTPSFYWGLTIIAATTSLPDAIISIRLARKGEGVVSLSNVLGSNIFDLLIAVPAGVLIAGSASLDFAVAVPLMGFLTLATIVLFTLMRTRLRLTEKECWFLLILYFLFLVWLLLESMGILRFLEAASG